MKRLLLVAVTLCVAGCASGYQKFYRPNTALSPSLIAQHRAGPPSAQPLLDHTGLTGQALLKAYSQQGYALLGYSSFNGAGNQSDSGALAQGKAVGADLVVVANAAFTGTRSSVIPITTPTSSTSYSSGTATAYGAGGSVTAYGSGTTTTYGSQTNYVPVSTDRYDYVAVYFYKSKTRFGAIVSDLSEAQRQQLQSNHGVAVLSVVNQSPAFESDVLEGDLIVAMDGQPVSGLADYQQLLDQKAGHRVKVTIYRNGTTITKDVMFNQ
jgi:membrane-associated protease RseP (regulator of RpoE activity)